MESIKRRRLFVRNQDRVSGDGSTFTIQLPSPVKNMIYAEWVWSNFTGFVLVDKFTNESEISNKVGYWRYVQSGVNPYFTTFPPSVDNPITFNAITVRLVDYEGTPLDPNQDYLFEVDIWYSL